MVTLDTLNTMPSNAAALKAVGRNGNVEFDHSLSFYLLIAVSNQP